MGYDVKKVGNKLVIEIPLDEGSPSSTGKMNLIANSGGWKNLDVDYKGKPLKMNLMLGYKPSD
jgi:hypothetical protein